LQRLNECIPYCGLWLFCFAVYYSIDGGPIRLGFRLPLRLSSARILTASFGGFKPRSSIAARMIRTAAGVDSGSATLAKSLGLAESVRLPGVSTGLKQPHFHRFWRHLGHRF
jgi:hypothetical protein